MKNLFVQGQRKTPAEFALATVTSVTGGLFLRFDGEAEARQKSYKRLGQYTPAVSDRVLVAKMSGTYVVLGEVV